MTRTTHDTPQLPGPDRLSICQVTLLQLESDS